MSQADIVLDSRVTFWIGPYEVLLTDRRWKLVEPFIPKVACSPQRAPIATLVHPVFELRLACPSHDTLRESKPNARNQFFSIIREVKFSRVPHLFQFNSDVWVRLAEFEDFRSADTGAVFDAQVIQIWHRIKVIKYCIRYS